MTTDAPAERHFRAIAVQPKWSAADFLSARSFEAWMRAQLEAARPHLHATQPTLVVLTELNGLPLVLRGGQLAVRTGTFQGAAAALLLQRLPAVLPIVLRGGVSVVRALQLACIEENAALYLNTCAALAREYGVFLVCGSTPMPHYRLDGRMLRREGTQLYNQTLILSPGGLLIGSADKVHLTPDEEAGGVDLSPGRLDELRVFPTPVGDLGVAISLDAFRADVLDCLRAQGCTVLLQPDANGSPWTGKEGIYPPGQTPRDQPLAWLESSWQVTATPGSIRYAVNPMVVGNLLDLSFDGQSAITGPADEAPQPRSYVMTAPRPGFLALAPWEEESSDLERLREVGQQLRAGSGHARENAYRTDLLHADLHLPPTRLDPPPATPHEDALRAYLSGRASFARPGLLARRGWWGALLLVVLAVLGRRVQRR